MTPAGKLLRCAAAIIIFAASLYPIRLLALRVSTINLSRPPFTSFVNFSLLPVFQPENPQAHSPLPSTLSFAYANVSVTNSYESTYSVRTLGIASRIYVVSLPRRVDRRTRMEALFNFMNLDLTWWDATSSQNAMVGVIMERVRWERAMHVIYTHWGLFPQSPVAQPVGGGSGLGLPTQSQFGFKSVSEVDAEDPVYWDEDAVANPYVYPPLNDNDDATKPLSSESKDGLSFFVGNEEQEFPANGTHGRSFELSGSELWTLDPLLDARSSQHTSPIPSPPVPDLRIPLPCAPLHLAFDMPSTEDPDWEGAQMADAALQHDDIDCGDGGDSSDPIPLLPRHLKHADLMQEKAAEEAEDAFDENNLHPMAPKSPYPIHLTLSRAMIACWNSHFRLLRHIADGSDEIAIVLEDDVDIEYDLSNILSRLISALPARWDIIFLGHCWSPHEDIFPSLPLPLTTVPKNSGPIDADHQGEQPFPFRLHPSFTPKCTHAYAVSRSGAARIIRHLRSTAAGLFMRSSSTENGTDRTVETETGSQGSAHKVRLSMHGLSFAYGRALDQAFVRLIQGRRISAFSIIPSVVVQTKESPSDITPGGNGSSWRDVVRDSALTRLRAQGVIKM